MSRAWVTVRWVWVTGALWSAAAPAQPERAEYLFFLKGVPVGNVTLTGDLSSFTYASAHYFPGGAAASAHRTWTKSWAISSAQGAQVPEAYWLWRSPALGCVPGWDERSDEHGDLCADSWSEEVLRGRLLGRPFVAHYAEHRLQTLELGEARFVRVNKAPKLSSPPDLFAEGLSVSGAEGRLAVSPRGAALSPPPLKAWSVAQARALAEELHRQTTARPGVQVCVEVANEFVRRAQKAGHEARVVTGLVVDDAKAFPHAWVRYSDETGRGAELDPALAIPVSARTHLALDDRRVDDVALTAGAAYLKLYSGELQVVREPDRR